MDIGVPREIKDKEYRVGLSPSTVRTLVAAGHRVQVETLAGTGSRFTDEAYEQAGATIVLSPEAAWEAELVVKVKEPLPQEYSFLKADQILFTYLHLAACRPLTEALLRAGGQAIAYESVELPQNSTHRFPLLTPMSVIAGRLSVQIGAQLLLRSQGGSGVLLSGVPGVRPGQVVILGGGVVGTEAARIAIGLGAQVTVLDINVERLGELEALFGARVQLLYSTRDSIAACIPTADLVIGAVLVPGRRPPILVSREMVEAMGPGSVIVDVAVDQGGCVETLRPTSHSQPTYLDSGVIHYGVPNMPGAVPWTATQALNNSTAPYVLQLAQEGLGACQHNQALARGLMVQAGKLVHPEVQAVFPDLA
ncbi:alanine dehydrogenase [Lyngbya confervoides]|uniref:Alanine dehydrogenase n=1 Tax=Lyngbya confervoides BDU141951 TaxID=1574623 RepID=A0ABD4SYV6_9CYAN|nr:alanine dehydrogenase [Lyngbya confervoides]MCM1981330.1 alanine dehydrogenase [Lyngbya confervoides BDU141951]